MKNIFVKLACISFCAHSYCVHAYEISTHAKITNFAYAQTQLNSNSAVLLKRFGIQSWVLGQATSKNPFGTLAGDYYFDTAK